MGVNANLGEKCRTRGSRNYMVETRGSEKERPGDEHEGSCDAPHGRAFGGEDTAHSFIIHPGGTERIQ
jgi:hypothetical protein